MDRLIWVNKKRKKNAKDEMDDNADIENKKANNDRYPGPIPVTENSEYGGGKKPEKEAYYDKEIVKQNITL